MCNCGRRRGRVNWILAMGPRKPLKGSKANPGILGSIIHHFLNFLMTVHDFSFQKKKKRFMISACLDGGAKLFSTTQFPFTIVLAIDGLAEFPS